MTKLTLTLPTPSIFWKPDSTAEVHAPHVIPPTLRVVVAHLTGRGLAVRVYPMGLRGGIKIEGGAIVPMRQVRTCVAGDL